MKFLIWLEKKQRLENIMHNLIYHDSSCPVKKCLTLFYIFSAINIEMYYNLIINLKILVLLWIIFYVLVL